jgi:hypothetical protein
MDKHNYRSIRMSNEGNPNWKGDKVGKDAVHIWVKRRYKRPNNCQECNKPNKLLDLANTSGKYLRDVTDWRYLCRKCHMSSDGRLDKWLQKNKSELNKQRTRDKQGRFIKEKP